MNSMTNIKKYIEIILTSNYAFTKIKKKFRLLGESLTCLGIVKFTARRMVKAYPN